MRVARGIIAIGGVAQGVVAFGGVAMGGITIGGLSLGIFSFGGLAVGLIALGGGALGLLGALGGGALAPIALGALAIGCFAKGALALGLHTVDIQRSDPMAVSFFGHWAARLFADFQIINFTMVALALSVGLGLPWWLQRRTGLKRNCPFWVKVMLVPVGILVLLVIILRHFPNRTSPPTSPGYLASQPYELKKQPTAVVLEAGLFDPQTPWAWQELQNRARDGQLNAVEANQIVDRLTLWLRQKNPKGYDQPFIWPDQLVEDLGKLGMVAETNELAFLRS